LTSAISAPNDGFYTPVTYRGAFKDVNWASDWGFAAEAGLITGAGAGLPRITVATNAVAPTLSARLAGGSIELSFSSQTGHDYQVQSRTDIGSELGPMKAPRLSALVRH